MAAETRKQALIFGAAPVEDWGFLQPYLEQHRDALVLCADGGALHAAALGLRPDFPHRGLGLGREGERTGTLHDPAG